MRLSLPTKASSIGLMLCAAGCAGRFDPANFEGSREAQRAEPEAVIDVAVRTADMETLGTVRVGCRLRPGFRPLAGELLSDLDCTTERLLAALHESAASAGGELLVGARCSSRRISTASLETHQLHCGAEVARYVSGPLANPRPLSVPRSAPPGRPAPTAADVKRIDEPEASLSFRIALTFQPGPAVEASERPVLRSDQVQELPRLPLSDQPLGDLVATCEDACEERALRYGVLIAAARLGAPDVVGVRCYSAGSGNACVGTLAAPERRE
ncbi:MAG: hypothetical protein ABUL62_32155 [Myxococcales bacterium]